MEKRVVSIYHQKLISIKNEMYTLSGAFSLGLNIFNKTRKIHFKLNYMFGDLLALAGVCKTKTKRRKIEFKCTYSSVSDMKDCIQVLQKILSTFLRIFPWEKNVQTKRKTVTTQNTRLQFCLELHFCSFDRSVLFFF